MLDTKFVCTLIGLIIAAIAICNFETKSELKENFVMNRSLTQIPTVQQNVDGHISSSNANVSSLLNSSTPGGKSVGAQAVAAAAGASQQGRAMSYAMHSDRENYQPGPLVNPIRKEPFGFQVPPNYQMNLSPRGVGNAEGFQNPHVKYNPPSNGKMAYQQMENYKNIAAKENYMSPPHFDTNMIEGKYLQHKKEMLAESDGAKVIPVLDSLPIPSMASGSPTDSNVSLSVKPTVSLRARSQGAGDPIRGDLPIPACPGQWFSSHQSFNPTSAIKQGAMLAMFGSGDAPFTGAATAKTNALSNVLSGLGPFADGSAISSQVSIANHGANHNALFATAA